VKVLEHLSAHNHVERGLTEGRTECERADVAQLDVEAKLARTGLGAIQAGNVDADELDQVAKWNERLPEVERFGSGAPDIENTKAPPP
jgi:hypothetical protein